MDNDQISVQSVAITMKLPDGKVVTGKFTGLAICGAGEWEQIKRIGLGEALHGNTPILFTDPKPIDQLISGDDKHDIVDAIRSELQTNHHSELSD